MSDLGSHPLSGPPPGPAGRPVGGASSGFTANVNVISQAAPDVDLDAYLATGASNLDAIDGKVLDQAYVTARDGATLRTMRYAATPPGGAGALQFLAVFDVRGGTAVVATLTAPADVFDSLVRDVEPYLLTLRATG